MASTNSDHDAAQPELLALPAGFSQVGPIEQYGGPLHFVTMDKPETAQQKLEKPGGWNPNPDRLSENPMWDENARTVFRNEFAAKFIRLYPVISHILRRINADASVTPRDLRLWVTGQSAAAAFAPAMPDKDATRPWTTFNFCVTGTKDVEQIKPVVRELMQLLQAHQVCKTSSEAIVSPGLVVIQPDAGLLQIRIHLQPIEHLGAFLADAPISGAACAFDGETFYATPRGAASIRHKILLVEPRFNHPDFGGDLHHWSWLLGYALVFPDMDPEKEKLGPDFPLWLAHPREFTLPEGQKAIVMSFLGIRSCKNVATLGGGKVIGSFTEAYRAIDRHAAIGAANVRPWITIPWGECRGPNDVPLRPSHWFVPREDLDPTQLQRLTTAMEGVALDLETQPDRAMEGVAPDLEAQSDHAMEDATPAPPQFVAYELPNGFQLRLPTTPGLNVATVGDDTIQITVEPGKTAQLEIWKKDGEAPAYCQSVSGTTVTFPRAAA